MRLPDPFTPNLKVDLLPEIAQPPRILSSYTKALAASYATDYGAPMPNHRKMAVQWCALLRRRWYFQETDCS